MTENSKSGGQKIKEQFILEERLKKPLPIPPWVKTYLDKRFDEAIEAAEWAYRTTGRWFFIPSGDNPYTEIGIRRWDECETSGVYGRLLQRMRLTELPNYSVKNHREAVKWWQSWQNSETGRFYNPIYVDPEHPEVKRKEDPVYDQYGSNEKYIPGVLKLLEASPLYPVQLHGNAKEGQFDYDAMLHFIEVDKIYNHGGKMLNELLRRIDKGESEGIPFAEYAIACAVDWIDPEIGIINRPGRGWGEYSALEPTLKTLGRMIGQQGIENMPPDKMRAFADFIIAKQPEFVSLGQAGNIRNTAELMLLAMAVSDYRKEEIMQALIEHSKSLEDPNLWEKTGYPAHACALIGGMIWWEEYSPDKGPGPELGGEFGHRIVMGPYHRWANLIKKGPDERAESEDYDYRRFGLKYRNQEHWARRVHEIIPTLSESGEHWRFSDKPVPADWTGRDFDDASWQSGPPPFGENEHLHLRRAFVLEDMPVEHPWLRADWDGIFNVFINGFPVKSTIRKWNKAGWYIPEQAAASLKPGRNIVAVECVRTDPASFIDIGLIDWR